MYINPSLQFVVALWLLNEPFNRDQLVGFCFIWVAPVVFHWVRCRARGIRTTS
jgi:chloramphenicol-sensitive protein RarD